MTLPHHIEVAVQALGVARATPPPSPPPVIPGRVTVYLREDDIPF